MNRKAINIASIIKQTLLWCSIKFIKEGRFIYFIPVSISFICKDEIIQLVGNRLKIISFKPVNIFPAMDCLITFTSRLFTIN